MSINKPQLIQLPKIQDIRGNLTFIQHPDHLPFAIKRVFWIYDVPGGETRGGHAYKTQHEVIISLSGSFDVVLKDGISQKVIILNKPNFGLLIPNGIWRELQNFSSGSVCLVLASAEFDEDDYIRNFKEFKLFKNRTS